jgi:hypothetical protein
MATAEAVSEARASNFSAVSIAFISWCSDAFAKGGQVRTSYAVAAFGWDLECRRGGAQEEERGNGGDERGWEMHPCRGALEEVWCLVVGLLGIGDVGYDDQCEEL